MALFSQFHLKIMSFEQIKCGDPVKFFGGEVSNDNWSMMSMKLNWVSTNFSHNTDFFVIIIKSRDILGKQRW